MSVVICVHFGVSFFILCEVFSSDQINIFTEEVVFCLNLSCKTIFILSFKTFQNSLSVSIQTFEGDRKNS